MRAEYAHGAGIFMPSAVLGVWPRLWHLTDEAAKAHYTPPPPSA